MKKTIDYLAKYQPYLLGSAIFLSLLAVSISVSKGQIRLILIDYPALMILLVLISITLILIYIRIDDYRIRKLSRQIKAQLNDEQGTFETLLSELTPRQKEVYQLIMSGKNNKEIMADLFIERSTLKTHINQIYKKLNVRNRQELKSGISG